MLAMLGLLLLLEGTKQAHSTTARATPNVVDSGPSSCQGQPQSPVKTENAAGSYFVEYSTKTICFGDVASIAGHVKLQIRENNGLGFQWYDDSVEVVGHYPGTTSHWFYTAGQNHCSTGTYRTVGWATWTNSSGQTGITNKGYTSAVTITC
jgi:hypothetical protein